MNKRQKEVEQAKLVAEARELNHLKGIYKKAAEDVSNKIAIHDETINVLLKDYDSLDDVQKSILQSKIYQKQFQESLQKQLDGFLADLNSGQYKSIDEYLNTCYETGFLGSMYDIHGQGIPIVTPIDQKQVVKAKDIDSKISKKLYTKMGEDVDLLKKRIANNISRGIATSDSFANMARNIAEASNMGFNRAMRIARTEGHRIQTTAAFDAQHAAKKAGAEIVKQWDAALDGRTRPTHRKLDGQIRELDEFFEVNGHKARFPSDFGRPEEDINCRCALLQRARWALDEDELQTLKDRAAYYGLDKTEDFEDFRKKYLKVSEKDDKIQPKDVLLKPIKSSEKHYKELLDSLEQLDSKVGCAYNPVTNHTKAVSQAEIIGALAGGDRTRGSCASVGLAYIGQKQGWNILDFRDGESRHFFSMSSNLHKLSLADGLKVLRAEGASSITVGNRLLKQCEEGKEYYLCVGRHASIVRKTEDGVLQYLELQSATKSGWTNFNGNPRYTLKTRFGCTQTSGSSAYYDFMIDLNESDFNTDDFKSLLGYINTVENEQRKGTSGTIK